MENVISRHRNLIILTAAIFAQLIGLASQVRRPADGRSVRLIRIWGVMMVTPLEHVILATTRGARGVWHQYINVQGVSHENDELREELTRMRLEQIRLAEDAGQAHRLQALLGFKEQFIAQTVAAQVISTTGSPFSRGIYIDKSAREGLKRDMAVITPQGIVGKVYQVFPETGTALVLEISDPSSGAGAILEKSRLQGILTGSGGGELVLQKVMSDEKVQIGERVLTSGGDRIYPKGLEVGTVTAVSPGSEGFLNIKVKPSADLDRVEEVLVITKVDERTPVAEPAAPMRAIDILEQRLPFVPAKPPDPKTEAGGQPKPSGDKPAASANPVAVGKPAGAAPEPGKPGNPAKPAPNNAATPATKAVADKVKPETPQPKENPQ